MLVTDRRLRRRPSPLARLRVFRFRFAFARHSHKLLGSCFKKYDATIVSQRFREGSLLSCARLIVTTQFQALLTPVSGCFSVFVHTTKCAIGLELCLELRVSTRVFALPNRATLLWNSLHAPTLALTRLSLSSTGLSSPLRLNAAC